MKITRSCYMARSWNILAWVEDKYPVCLGPNVASLCEAHLFLSFFFNDTATTEIYTLSLHDALPISPMAMRGLDLVQTRPHDFSSPSARSEEHTAELQSRRHLVCRLLLEKKKRVATRSSTRTSCARCRRRSWPCW